MDSRELRERTKQFALRIMRVVDALPGTVAGRAIGSQLIRAGTSVGANYRSACRGRSKAEFASKLGIVLEEIDETGFWLELIMDGRILPRKQVEPLYVETNELTAIFAASVLTSKKQRPS